MILEDHTTIWSGKNERGDWLGMSFQGRSLSLHRVSRTLQHSGLTCAGAWKKIYFTIKFPSSIHVISCCCRFFYTYKISVNFWKSALLNTGTCITLQGAGADPAILKGGFPPRIKGGSNHMIIQKKGWGVPTPGTATDKAGKTLVMNILSSWPFLF